MAKKEWRKVASKVLLKHPRLTVYEDNVQLPNGLKTTYLHFGSDKNAAQTIAINDSGKILLQKEYSYPPNEWLYQFPGGLVETSETPQDAALRELSEEAGYTGKLEDLGWFYLNNRRTDNRFHVFVATGLKRQKAEQDPEEEFKSYWLSEEEIDSLIAKGELVNYSALAAWSLFKNKYKPTPKI